MNEQNECMGNAAEHDETASPQAEPQTSITPDEALRRAQLAARIFVNGAIRAALAKKGGPGPEEEA